MLKKAILATAALALSAPALADRGNGHGYGHGHYRQEHRVVHRPVVYRPVYHVHRPAPHPVVVVHRPAPVVYHSVHHSHPHTGAAILFGAVLGAAIAHHVTMGY